MPSHAPVDDGLPRSGWATSTTLMRDYYDHEWGLPVTEERALFERLCLEGFQAGLSWATILSRREEFRRAFADFDPEAVAAFDEDDVERLVQDATIIRSRAKIEAAIGNARTVLELRRQAVEGDPALAEFEVVLQDGSVLEIGPGLPALVWGFLPETTPVPADFSGVPTQTAESAALAKELKRRGMKFIGPTSAYALMEAIGMQDTHWADSHRRGVAGIFAPDGTREPVRR